jgi:hypothetical protein
MGRASPAASQWSEHCSGHVVARYGSRTAHRCQWRRRASDNVAYRDWDVEALEDDGAEALTSALASCKGGYAALDTQNLQYRVVTGGPQSNRKLAPNKMACRSILELTETGGIVANPVAGGIIENALFPESKCV